MKFTIITPTIGRRSLVRTCESLDAQTCQNWQHVVMVDGVCELPEGLAHPNREFHHFLERHNDGGSFARNQAHQYISGDYVLYLDDDDYYKPNALETLDKNIKGEIFGIFPIHYCGRPHFLQIPPGENRTSICQYYHKPFDDKGLPLAYPNVRKYSIDSWFAGDLAKKYGYKVIESEDLVVVEKLSCPGFKPAKGE